MRCPRCGNDNTDTNRFCGMCGASLAPAQATGPSARPPSPWPTSSASNKAAAAQPSSSDSASPDLTPRPEPAITGPSFLGLGTPPSHADSKSNRAGGVRDQLQSSRNLDYLLEDFEQPKHGSGKIWLLLIAVALAAGFGYLHWKQGGFDWVNGEKKPSAATPAPDAGGNNPPTNNSPTTSPPAVAPSAAPPASTAPGSGTASSGIQAAPEQNPASQTSASQNPPAQSSGSQNTAQPEPAAPQNTQAQPENQTSPKQPPAAEEVQKAPPKKPAAEKPAAAKPAAGAPADKVAEAERYIYGNGVHQDCDRGLRLLKPSADQGLVKAMVSMGVLYSTGTCTPRDLPTAYRWFAQALHKDPDNKTLQDDLQNLWGQMTPPERQLAIRLSQ